MCYSTLPITIPGWATMWGIAVVIFASLKWLTSICREPSSAPVWKQYLYLFGWPGMDVNAFLNTRPKRSPKLNEWLFATFECAFGVGVLLFILPCLSGSHDLLIGWVGIIGILFALHFGLFHILSCVYRQLGINAVPIMNCPIASHSVADFWCNRWNLAFRDLTHQFVFRPLVRMLGPTSALMTGFLVSGLVHEAVISVPAGGGYGLPTCYFVVQGLAILAERTVLGRVIGLGNGLVGWLFTLAVLLTPCTLLFHKPFLSEVIVPFLRAMGLLQ